jgi:hypothetical protein
MRFKTWMSRSALLLALSLLPACAGMPTATDCQWARVIRPSAGWEERLSDDELRQLVRHNELVDRLCAN